MPIELAYETLEDIPEGYSDLYVEQDNKFVLTGVTGMKTQADVDQVKAALDRQTRLHKETKDKYRPWADLDFEDVQGRLDRIEELEAQVEAGGQIDEGKLSELVEKRLVSKTKPLERQLEALNAEKTELSEAVETYKAANLQREIHDEIRTAAVDLRVKPQAVEDVLMMGERLFEKDESGKIFARDNVGITPGIDPKAWLGELVETKDYLLQDSEGGGGKGSSGKGHVSDNPWKKDQFNLTKQAKVEQEKGKDYAKALAAQAGAVYGSFQPPA